MLLERHGCKYQRDARHGGHEIWLCPGQRPLSVPKNIKGEGTLQKILKDSGVRDAMTPKRDERPPSPSPS
jgi:hypothetical protein